MRTQTRSEIRQRIFCHALKAHKIYALSEMWKVFLAEKGYKQGVIKKTPNYFSVVLNGDFAGTKISAENLFSLPICVIMDLHRRAGACSRRFVCLCHYRCRGGSMIPQSFLKYWTMKSGGLLPPLHISAGASPPPYQCLFCNSKRTVDTIGGAFAVMLSPLRTTEIFR